MSELEKFLEKAKSEMVIDCCLAEIDLAIEQAKRMHYDLEIGTVMNVFGVFVYLMMIANKVNLTVTGALAKSEERINHGK